MITVRLPSGQILTFPDGTPESVIQAAAARAHRVESSIDLSGLRSRAATGTEGMQPAKLPAPPEPLMRFAPSSTPERDATSPPRSSDAAHISEWEDVSPVLQRRRLPNGRFEYRPRPIPGAAAGTNRDGQLDAGYRVPTAADRLRAAYEMEGRPVATPEERDLAAEFTRGIPARVAESEGGMLLPIQAVGGLVRGAAEEIRSTGQGIREGHRFGPAMQHGFEREMSGGALSRGVAAVRHDLVDPARERLSEAAMRAGLSPTAAASADAAQLLAGEALNPGNYIGPESFRGPGGFSPGEVPIPHSGSAGSTSLPPPTAEDFQIAAKILEKRGVFQDTSVGQDSAINLAHEIRDHRLGAQQLPAGDLGDLAAADRELSDRWLSFLRTKGVENEDAYYALPSADKHLLDAEFEVRSPDPKHPSAYSGGYPKPPEGFPTYHTGYSPRIKIRYPEDSVPVASSIRSEEPPLPLPVLGEGVHPDQVIDAWSYVSRRHPRLAARVKSIELLPDSYRGMGAAYSEGTLFVHPDGELSVSSGAHELTHLGQDISNPAYRDLHGLPVDERLAAISEDKAARDTIARAEGDAYTRSAAYHHLDDSEAGVPVEDLSYLSNGELWDRLRLVDEDVAGARPGSLEASRLGYYQAQIEDQLSQKSRLIGQSPDELSALRERTSRRTGALPVDFQGEAPRILDWNYRTAKPDTGDPFADVPLRDTGYGSSEGQRLFGELPPEGRSGDSLAVSPEPLPEPAPQPPQPEPAILPEEFVAERMGWKPPIGAGSTMPGSPRAVGPPIHVDEPGMHFQTNIAAQLGGDEQVANYVIQQSNDVFRAIGPLQSWDTVEELASRLGQTKEELLSRPSHWNVMSPETRLRLLYVIKGNEEKIGALQGKLVDGAATDLDKAELLRAIDSRADMLQLGAKTGSAYGRALNTLKMEARLTLGEDHLLRQRLYRQYADQIDADRPLLDTLARLDPHNPEELQSFLRAVNRPNFREHLQEYWVSSVLSAPTAHERNLIGNTVNAVLENAIVRPVAAGFDAARVAGMGADATREVFFRETPAAIVGLTRGIRHGLRKGLEIMRRGYDPTTMTGKLYPVRSAFARSQNRVVREVIGPVVTTPLRMLSASDAVYKTMNWTAEIYAQAARAAAKAGLSGDAFAAEVARLVANPTDEMIDAADKFALKATFNDPASEIGKAVMGLRDIPLADSNNPAVHAAIETYRTGMGFILPFLRIADRLMVRGFEYTPWGAVASVGARRAGNMAEAADLAARAAIGSGVMAYAASLAMEGRLTGSAPTDEAEKAAFYGSGKQAWSVRTEDGVWIPYGGLMPIAVPFALVASAWKGWQEHQEEPSADQLGQAAAEVGSYVTDQSYMDGLSKFMDAIGGSESERGRAFSDLATNTTWGGTPFSGLVRTVAKGIDPRVIDAKTIGQRLQQNVPGMSLGMEARLTPWGEDVVPVGGRMRSVMAPGSVLLPSREVPNPLDQELERLGMPLGYVGKTISNRLYGGKSGGEIKLSQPEWSVYQQTAGRASRVLLTKLFADPDYWHANTEMQRDAVERAIGAAREYAKIMTVRYHRGLGAPGINPTQRHIRLIRAPLEVEAP